MKKVKVVLWILITVIIILFIVQNQELLTLKQTLKIDFHMYSYQSPELPNAILFLACFFIGCLLTYFFSLSNRFKLNRNVKQLGSDLAALREQIAAYESERQASVDTAVIEEEESGIGSDQNYS
jgi:uncharacterized integral membrane protein